ncbi:MAG: DUF4878 domain-containing protein [Fimbriimonas ginsengisoli]|uniref:DUF4878 domain-containing protein n=1 Tax=Fimbriimonas ginsengisoli TaxID=1005039 RepID=A0A931LU20_FIMGI|nr:DUF4878 domain-containing protein [Fimbriimonas ginsengisoli]
MRLQQGRMHWLTMLALVALVALLVAVVLSGATPASAASDFMLALARGDVDRLTDLSVLGEETRGEMRSQWEFSTKVAAPNYRFTWTIGETRKQGANEAGVRIEMNSTPFSGDTTPDRFDLPLVKEGGKWKVHVQAINREFFPCLPR